MQHKSMSNPVQTLIECVDDALRNWSPLGVDLVETYMWPQTHNSTGLGFPGVSGQAITRAMTVVVYRRGTPEEKEVLRVYHGGRLAYEVVEPTNRFWDEFHRHALPGQQEFIRRRGEFVVTLEEEPSQEE